MRAALVSLGLIQAALFAATVLAVPSSTPLIEREDIHILRRADTGAPPSSQDGAMTIKPLPYAYNALEPVISEAIMKLHHDKHLQAYITGYNENIAKHAAAGGDLTKQLALVKPLTFNAGGIVNHYLFFDNLTPPKSAAATLDEASELGHAVKTEYGGMDALIADFTATAATFQGSGWVWLGYDSTTKTIFVTTTTNQFTLLQADPLVAIDLWEHAYYLDYKNVRADYVKAILTIINWQEANKRYIAAKSKPKM